VYANPDKYRTAHAEERAVERYGHKFNASRLLKKIRNGEGKLITLCGYEGRLIYDVPHKIPGQDPTFVRVVVNPERTLVITVLPQQSPQELAKAKVKKIADSNGHRKREFFKRFDDDEES
jgi:hypothetical protein